VGTARRAGRLRGGDEKACEQSRGAEGRAIAGPHDYEQIPALVERSVLRVKNFSPT